MKELFENILKNCYQGISTVIVTVIHSEGSAPRGFGAQMLCSEKGLICGTIGGGSAEYKSIQLAKNVLTSKTSRVETFELNHTDITDLNSVCGGRISTLFQYIDKNDATWIETVKTAMSYLSQGIPGYLSLQNNECKIVTISEARNMPADSVLIPLPVKERAIIFGAGHISVALSKLLSFVGFHVIVFDDREELLTQERFSTADELILGDYLNIKKYITIDEADYICVLTSGHKSDYDVEFQLLPDKHVYFGVIGSKAKTKAVNEKLLNNGISADRLETVSTPIGLAIKAVTPEEIAVSIVSEMILIRSNARAEKMNNSI